MTARGGRPLPGRPGWRVVATAALLVPTLACFERDRAGDRAQLTRQEFIDVVVAIREAELAVEALHLEPDSVQALFEARRDSILTAHGTTETALRTFLDRHSELAYMEGVWETITQRLKRPIDGPRRIDPVLEAGEAEDGKQPAGPTRGPLLRDPR